MSQNNEDDGVLVDVSVINKIWLRFFWVFAFLILSIVGLVVMQYMYPAQAPENNFLSESFSLLSTTINMITATVIGALGAWAGAKAQKAITETQQLAQKNMETNRKQVHDNQLSLAEALDENI